MWSGGEGSLPGAKLALNSRIWSYSREYFDYSRILYSFAALFLLSDLSTLFEICSNHKNMKHIFIYPMAAVCAAFSVHAAPPQGYYDSLEGKCGAEPQGGRQGEGAQAHGDKLRRRHVGRFPRDRRARSGRKALLVGYVYSSNNVPVSSGHPGMNIEHSVANSCWGGSKNDAYKDLFHLNPSDATANNRKSNFPLGIVVGTPTWTNGVTVVGHPAAGDCGGAKNVYEPHDMYKGDFARVYFYIFTVYDDISWGAYSDKRDAMYDCSAYPSLKPWAYDIHAPRVERQGSGRGEGGDRP